jgi:hypothetical protein
VCEKLATVVGKEHTKYFMTSRRVGSTSWVDELARRVGSTSCIPLVLPAVPHARAQPICHNLQCVLCGSDKGSISFQGCWGCNNRFACHMTCIRRHRHECMDHGDPAHNMWVLCSTDETTDLDALGEESVRAARMQWAFASESKG